ncbi:hypothetical protein D3C76_1075770 [compost metagenome]
MDNGTGVLQHLIHDGVVTDITLDEFQARVTHEQLKPIGEEQRVQDPDSITCGQQFGTNRDPM